MAVQGPSLPSIAVLPHNGPYIIESVIGLYKNITSFRLQTICLNIFSRKRVAAVSGPGATLATTSRHHRQRRHAATPTQVSAALWARMPFGAARSTASSGAALRQRQHPDRNGGNGNRNADQRASDGNWQQHWGAGQHRGESGGIPTQLLPVHQFERRKKVTVHRRWYAEVAQHRNYVLVVDSVHHTSRYAIATTNSDGFDNM